MAKKTVCDICGEEIKEQIDDEGYIKIHHQSYCINPEVLPRAERKYRYFHVYYRVTEAKSSGGEFMGDAPYRTWDTPTDICPKCLREVI